MIILGINRTNHDNSIALLKDNKVLLHIQEERLNNIKHAASVFQSLNLIKKYVDHVDIIALSGIDPVINGADTNTDQDVYSWFVSKLGKSFNKNRIKVYDYSSRHHEIHAFTAFYNSGFKDALCIVRDGRGSITTEFNGNSYAEYSSVFNVSYPTNIELIENISLDLSGSSCLPTMRIWQNDTTSIVNTDSDAGAYDVMGTHFGLTLGDGAGKIMGMSSYGKEDLNIKPFYVNGLIDNVVFKSKINENSILFEGTLPDNFQTRANYAYRLQKDMQETVTTHILSMLSKTGKKNICLYGGLFLNCVANYYLLKRLPKDINIYIEPMATDNGNAVGAAKYAFYSETQSTEVLPQKSIYYGPEYSYSLKELPNEGVTYDVTPEYVAKLLNDRNIVALYQGKSEAGPRALGNRSILYDPRDPKGKDHVNTVKGREWYRPFAGTVLQEKAKDWFDLGGLAESPYMMYAVDVLLDKRALIPAITHIDGTCRIQTLKKEVNPNYYSLIESFEALTGVPILFNTSFNLAGDAIVETLEDALFTLSRSNIDYLYLPELSAIIKNPKKG